MDRSEIQQRVASFDRWHYEFDLGGVRTPIFDEDHRNRHRQRYDYFFTPLLEICGGSLEGKRVLDLGCNAGYWSLEAIKAGAAFVYGVDGRQEHIDQAHLVFEVNEVDPDRYRFELGNILTMDFSPMGEFDVVLCLGLMYHVSKPVEMVENFSRVATDLVVIDTETTPVAGNVVSVRKEALDEPRNAIDYEIVFLPSRQTIRDILATFGFSSVVLRRSMTDYRGMFDYALGRRFAVIGSRRTDLSGLATDDLEQPLSSLEHFTRRQVGRASYVISALRQVLRPGVRNRGRGLREAFRNI